MKKRVLAGIMMMILALASVMTVSAANSPSRTDDPYVSEADENGRYKVETTNPFSTLDASVKSAIETYNKGGKLDDLLKGAKTEVTDAAKARIAITKVFDLVAVNGGQPEGGKHEVTVTVPGVDKATDVVVLNYNANGGWEVLKATVSGEKVTATYTNLGPVIVLGKVSTDTSNGTSDKTVGTSSTWMLYTAIALVALGAGVVAYQKKNR